MDRFRKEADGLGEVEVPADRLWGAQTQRSLEHFSIGQDLIPREMTTSIFVDALATVRTTLEAMPTRLSHRLVGLDALAIRSVLLAEVDSILKEMADGLAAPGR